MNGKSEANRSRCAGCLALIAEDPNAVPFCALGGDCKALDKEIILGAARDTPRTSWRTRRAS
jgi:hypothetical protein